MSLGVIKDKDETYGFTMYDPEKEGSKSMCKPGLFVKVFDNYIKLSYEVTEILNDPNYITIELDESGNRLLIRKADECNSYALKVSKDKREKRKFDCIHCLPLVKKLHEMFGDGIVTVYGHHIGRMADSSNGIIFSLKDTIK